MEKCPSGALSFYLNGEQMGEPGVVTETIAEVMKDGPLLVYGNITVKAPDGSQSHKTRTTAFCRCGGSANKPYCDGSHTRNGFKD